jgi:hypothetical protein|tara:strand:- start:1053 stop:1241 length:189 start_codon:yes stop_codon:yes gene_type:complete
VLYALLVQPIEVWKNKIEIIKLFSWILIRTKGTLFRFLQTHTGRNNCLYLPFRKIDDEITNG